MLRNAILCLCFALISSCATTDDPRQGGLLSYWAHGEAAYQKRLNERNHALDSLERQGDRERQLSSDLEAEREAKLAELERQRRMLVSLDASLDGIKKKIVALKAVTATQQKEKQRLEGEVKRLRDGIGALQKDTQLTVQEKKQRTEKLNAEIESLLAVAASL